MRIAHIYRFMGRYDGMGYEIFISGCRHGCKGCQNPDLWNFDYGNEMSIEEIISYMKDDLKLTPLKLKFYDKIILTGGDPLYNGKDVLELINAIRENFPNLEVWLYTGFTKEEIKEDNVMEECFNLCDVVVTDRYIEGLPSTHLAGSNNQRVWRKGILPLAPIE